MDRGERGSARSIWRVSRCGERSWLRASVVGTFTATLVAVPLARGQDLAPSGADTAAPFAAPVPGGLESPPAPAPGDIGLPTLPATGAAGPPPIAGGGQAAQNGQQRQRLWLILPRITLAETATDNARGTATNRQSDLITTISPGLFVDGQSSRLKGTLDYSPSVLRHITATDENTVTQNLLGNGTLTAVPDLLFFDANASMSQQSRSGTQGLANTSQIPANDSTQQMTYAGSPYLRFHLDDLAESELRYRFSQTHFSGNTGAVVSPVTGQSLSALSDVTDQQVLATVKTLQEFSRLQGSLNADFDAINYTDGSLSSRREEGSVDLSYAITQVIFALAGGGYEHLTYAQQSKLNSIGPTYKIGARYARNNEQTLELDYGRRDGTNSFGAIGRYAVSPVTNLSVSYTKGRTSTQQQLLNSLLTTAPTGPGTAVNTTTGLPTSIINGGNLITGNVPLRNDVVLSENATIGLTNAVGRNSYSVALIHVKQKSLLGLSPSTGSNGGIASWTHALSPSVNSNLSVSDSAVSPGNTNVASVAASISYAFSQTLQAGLLYNVFVTTGGAAAAGANTVIRNDLTLSLTKTF